MPTVDRLDSTSLQPSRRAGDVEYAALMDKADLCAAALIEARRLSGVAMLGSLYAQLDQRTREMLEELDDALLLLDLNVYRDAFQRLAALHSEYEELQLRRESLGV